MTAAIEVSDDAERRVIKAAKKTLKRQESGSMKIKSLAKEVIENSSSNSDIPNCKDTVRKMISDSGIFEIVGKNVSLKKKRNSVSSTDSKKKLDGDEPKAKKSRKAKVESTEAIASDVISTQTWRKTHKIVIKDSRSGPDGVEATKLLEKEEQYYPFQTFHSHNCVEELDSKLIEQCTKVNGFEKPSPIQAQCWPILLHVDDKGVHRDVVGIAETGSGKTLAFSMPALSVMAKTTEVPNKRGRSPRMLVLAPTRELAMQSQKVLEEFGAVVNLTSTVIYGGVPKPAQKDILRKGVDCIVCTPGRLKDLINEGSCDLSGIAHLVLDEADRMLDMGFEEDVRFIISKCKSKESRQTAMFSATWPAAIQQLALEFMVDPVCIYVGFESIVGSNGENAIDDSLSANKRVSQTVEVLEDRAREARLRELVGKYSKGKKKNDRILVFALYKKEAARLEGTLNRWGFSCASIHGDKTQDARNRALAEFKDGSCPILVATDVAARGLDIPDVEVVINYTFPLTIEDYVHRIGRTGRAGKSGISHTFFQPGDKSHAGELQQVMRQAGQDVPEELLKFGSTIKKKEHKLYGNFGPKDGPMKKAVKITFDSDGE
jgi:ATP-dependent RNA helicase DBP3